jgi:hypothetical protein
MKLNFYTTMGLLFSILAIILFFMANTMALHFPLLLGGNVVLVSISALSYYILMKDVKNKNPRKFVNSMMASTMIRFFTCLIGIAAVIFYFKNSIPKINIFLLMFLYIIYSMIENYFVMKVSKKMNASN